MERHIPGPWKHILFFIVSNFWRVDGIRWTFHLITTAMTDHISTITVVHCWSAPRSRSTALLYSFEARGDDTIALDEPLYREWLLQKGDTVERPYLANVIDGTSPDGENVDKWQREQSSLQARIHDAVLSLSGKSAGVIFCKHMSKHSILYNLEQPLLVHVPPNVNMIERHVLLIRDPVAVLSSWSISSQVHGNSPSTDEVSIIPLLSIYSTLSSHSKLPVVLLDSDDLVTDPTGTLHQVCEDLGICYSDAMLTWAPGPKDCDGPWAKVGIPCSSSDPSSVLSHSMLTFFSTVVVWRRSQVDWLGTKITYSSSFEVSHTWPNSHASVAGIHAGI